MSESPPFRTRTYDVFAVFDTEGRIHTARDKRRQAEEAAAILFGSDWTSRGITVEPVQITRFTLNRGNPGERIAP